MWPSSSRGIKSRELYFIRKPPASNGSGADSASETLSTTLKEVSSRILTAIQRLELCRFGSPLCPVPPPAKLRDFVLAWANRNDRKRGRSTGSTNDFTCCVSPKNRF